MSVEEICDLAVSCADARLTRDQTLAVLLLAGVQIGEAFLALLVLELA